MDIAEVLRDEDLRRRNFPVSQHRVFLAHAAVCALPGPVAHAMKQCADEGAHDDQETFLAKLLHDTRANAARLLGAGPDEIALVGPTSLALSFVAGGLEFKSGDNIIAYLDDYPSNVYPWLALAQRGVQVRFLEPGELGRITPEDVLARVDTRTRMVALASCHFISGWRLDIETLGRELRARDILFCVDGIQSLGALATPVTHVDFLAADAHKWLLGPCAAGILYVRREIQDRLRPLAWGWHNVHCPDFIAQRSMQLKPDARRYEAGTHNIVGAAGLHAALRLLLGVSVDAIHTELLRKRSALLPRLLQKGWHVLGHDAPEVNQSAILSIHRPGTDLPALHARLAEKDFTVSLRTDRTGQHYLRLSPHFYNTDTELDQLLEEL